MKQIVFILLFVGLSFTAQAQDAAIKPFSEMSYEELMNVDQASLDKKAKKALKKALSKAKKAEKARQRAEKKRLKAEAQAEKKRQRVAAKKLKKTTKVYSSTVIGKDEFSAFIEVVGPQNFVRKGQASDLFDMQPVPKYSLISLIDPQSGTHELKAYIHTSVNDPEFNSGRLMFLGISAEEYARRKGFWKDFQTASLSGGVQRNVLRIRQSAESCTDIACYFDEDVAVELNAIDLKNALRAKSELAFKLSGKRGSPVIVRIPYSYLVGYAWKLSELNSSMAEFSELSREGRAYILNDGK